MGEPVNDFWSYDQQKFMRSIAHPHCCLCGEPIWQDTAVCIAGDYFCDACLKDTRVGLEANAI